MATSRLGFTDSLHQSRLNYIAGTTFPAVPAGNYLALFSKAPLSDGTGGTEVTGTRPAITLGSPVAAGDGSYYITHASAVNNIALANTSACEVVAFGIYDANSAGTLVYTGPLPYHFPAAAGATVSIAAGSVKVYSNQ